jgi:hypothetical protein
MCTKRAPTAPRVVRGVASRRQRPVGGRKRRRPSSAGGCRPRGRSGAGRRVRVGGGLSIARASCGGQRLPTASRPRAEAAATPRRPLVTYRIGVGPALRRPRHSVGESGRKGSRLGSAKAHNCLSGGESTTRPGTARGSAAETLVRHRWPPAVGWVRIWAQRTSSVRVSCRDLGQRTECASDGWFSEAPF